MNTLYEILKLRKRNNLLKSIKKEFYGVIDEQYNRVVSAGWFKFATKTRVISKKEIMKILETTKTDSKKMIDVIIEASLDYQKRKKESENPEKVQKVTQEYLKKFLELNQLCDLFRKQEEKNYNKKPGLRHLPIPPYIFICDELVGRLKSILELQIDHLSAALESDYETYPELIINGFGVKRTEKDLLTPLILEQEALKFLKENLTKIYKKPKKHVKIKKYKDYKLIKVLGVGVSYALLLKEGFNHVEKVWKERVKHHQTMILFKNYDETKKESNKKLYDLLQHT